MNEGKSWTYMRLCVSCAEKFGRAGFEVEEIADMPTKRCRCEVTREGEGHRGEFCL